MRKILTTLFASLLWASAASAQTIIGNLPFTLQNGSIADANQVMADLNAIVSAVNTNAANAGANSNITALNGLTTPLVYTSGGTSVYIGGTSSGSANAQVVSSPIPSGFNLIQGKRVVFTAGFANTGPMTLNVASTGAINVFRQGTAGPVALTGGEVQVGYVVEAIYDGTEYQISGTSPQSLVPSCTVIDWVGASTVAGVGPSGYLLMNGQAVSRTTFSGLFNCIAVQGVAATTTNGSTSVTVPNSALFAAQGGWFVGGNNVTCNSTITAIPDGTHITISNPAGASGSTTLTIGPYPQGDCSTTFNVGNFIGRATAMRDGSSVLTIATCGTPATIGSNCGAQTETLTLLQVPGGLTSSVGITSGQTNIAFGGSGVGTFTCTCTGGGSVALANVSSGGFGSFNASALTGTATSNNTGASGNGTGAAQAHPILGPVALVDKYIKF